jgi:hypothetical protein
MSRRPSRPSDLRDTTPTSSCTPRRLAALLWSAITRSRLSPMNPYCRDEPLLIVLRDFSALHDRVEYEVHGHVLDRIQFRYRSPLGRRSRGAPQPLPAVVQRPRASAMPGQHTVVNAIAAIACKPRTADWAEPGLGVPAGRGQPNAPALAPGLGIVPPPVVTPSLPPGPQPHQSRLMRCVSVRFPPLSNSSVALNLHPRLHPVRRRPWADVGANRGDVRRG